MEKPRGRRDFRIEKNARIRRSTGSYLRRRSTRRKGDAAGRLGARKRL